MCRPSFDLTCNYLFKKFIKDTPRSKKLEELIQIPRIDEVKLAQLCVLATRGSIESIVEYARYLMLENSFSDAKFVLIQGAIEGDAYCRSALNILSKTSLNDDNSIKSVNLKDAFELTNHGYLCYRSKKLDEAIESLELAYSKGVAYAGYLLGLIYESKEVKDMTFKRSSSFIMMLPEMEMHLLSLNSVFAWRKGLLLMKKTAIVSITIGNQLTSDVEAELKNIRSSLMEREKNIINHSKKCYLKVKCTTYGLMNKFSLMR